MYRAKNNSIEKGIESWNIIIPLHDNDNLPFDDTIIENIKEKIISEFGGYSSINAIGAWKGDNKIFNDKNIQIIVDVPESSPNVEAFFTSLKIALKKELNQEKIYVKRETQKIELLTVNEFLQELGFEVTENSLHNLTQKNIDTLVQQSEIIKNRFSYKTLGIYRDKNDKTITWEREIFGIKLKTKFNDEYSEDSVLLGADQIEDYFVDGVFGKPTVIIGDYEYQSFILDKEKRQYAFGKPSDFEQFNKKGENEIFFNHLWHGKMTVAEFIVVFTEHILVNYIILRESGFQNSEIKITVGSDGSLQYTGKKVMFCPANISNEDVQLAIIENLTNAIETYENGEVNSIALAQIKALNRFNWKKAAVNKTK